MRKRALLNILILLTVSSMYMNGQKLVNSPYARFNAGILNQPGTFRSLAMGGISIAMRDNNTISFGNPASYTAFDTTSFIFDMGLDLSSLKLDDGTTKFSTTDMNFRHLMIGFPVSKKIDVAVGIVPYSNGYYYISEQIKNSSPVWNPLTGDYVSVHKGTGTISMLFAGSGFEITKNISAGFNITGILGKLERLNSFEFSEYQSTFSQSGREKLTISGFNLEYGIQYTGKISKDYFLTAGISAAASKNYKSGFELLKERYAVYNYPPYSPDTLVYYKSDATDSTRLPGSYRFGVMFGKKDKFTVGIDYVITTWNEARIHGGNAEMANTRSLMAGVEYIPEKFSNTSFLRRIEYRLGGHISDNYLVLNGFQLKEYGISGGLAIRLKNSLSKASLYLDYTRRQGDNSAGLHNENIFSAGVSLNFYDFWFVKRKYD